MTAPARTSLATIAGNSPCERIEVALRQGSDGALCIELLQQHFGEGIGWFTQRSLTLDSRQWRQIQTALGSRGVSSEIDDAVAAPREVLPFPVHGERPTRRPAAGAR